MLSAMALNAGTNQESRPGLMSKPSFLFDTRIGRSGRHSSEGLNQTMSFPYCFDLSLRNSSLGRNSGSVKRVLLRKHSALKAWKSCS